MGSRTWWRWMVVVAAAFATAGLQAGEISARRNSARPSDKKPSSLSYNRDILPILSDNCFACHGPDKNTREAKLRLDVREAAVGKRRKGFAIKPGHPAASLVMKRILTDDPDELMPPPDSTKKLTDAQKKLIRRWIEQGAEYDPHWAYIRPKRFSVPKVPGSGWVQRNPIDGFIHLSLKSHGLRPSPEADRRTLIRRLSFDLTGLPPTPKQVEAFVNDKAPKAYAKLVDRLLASPHYGERMAMHWLDIVRYADTVGYHGDQNVSVSPYRDYVIESFNQNVPYDRFTREQLAGDLLPESTERHKIASGYNRLGMMSAEGGVQPKEYLAKYAAERVRNASAVWMGATMGCAECHDHKFDPYTQKDFYSFAAFFADITEKGIYKGASRSGNFGTSIKVQTEADRKELQRLEHERAVLQKKLDAPHPNLDAEQAAWEQSQTEGASWQTLRPTTMEAGKHRKLKIEKDGSIFASKKGPEKDTYELTVTVQGPATGLRLELLKDKRLPSKGPGRAGNGNLVLTGFEVLKAGKPLKLTDPTATYSQNSYEIKTLFKTKPRDKKGWAVMKGKSGAAASAVFAFADPLPEGKHTLVVRMHHHYGSHHMAGRFRLAVTADPGPLKAGGSGLPGKISKILKIASTQRSAAQNKELANYFRTIAPSLAPLRKQIADLESRREALKKSGTSTLVTVATKPRTMRVLPRGNWMDESGPVVEPAVPHFLPQIEKAGRANRLDLANWLVSPNNPMVARAFVNRLWKMFHGVAISRVMDDLGAQGEAPVHPKLLDWLATEFVRSGWDVKHMVRLMVTSATYRQSSLTPPALREADPYNRLLARQSRFRLDAEMIRDNALAVSGLLVRRIGGKSVKPYQPKGYYAHLNFPKRKYKASEGEGLWRRGLYTHWQRQFLHPMLKAFDAPSREECAIERPRSNTPSAALVLLNDPSFVEAARKLADRTIAEGGRTPAERIGWLFELVLSRPATPDEKAVCRNLYEQELAAYRTRPEEAKELLSVGEAPQAMGDPAEQAAWTAVCRALLNMHETITRN